MAIAQPTTPAPMMTISVRSASIAVMRCRRYIATAVSSEYRSYTFKRGGWETVDTYWSSPFSYWVGRGIRVEPKVPLRVTLLGREVACSEEGWIDFGGWSAMFVHRVQARADAGTKIRIEITDGYIGRPNAF